MTVAGVRSFSAGGRGGEVRRGVAGTSPVGAKPGISIPTRLLVSWPGALKGPIRPTLSTGLGIRMSFFLLLFLLDMAGNWPSRWAMLFSGASLCVDTWDTIPVQRPGAPLSNHSGMTFYSLTGWAAEAAQTHDLATSSRLPDFSSQTSTATARKEYNR